MACDALFGVSRRMRSSWLVLNLLNPGYDPQFLAVMRQVCRFRTAWHRYSDKQAGFLHLLNADPALGQVRSGPVSMLLVAVTWLGWSFEGGLVFRRPCGESIHLINAAQHAVVSAVERDWKRLWHLQVAKRKQFIDMEHSSIDVKTTLSAAKDLSAKATGALHSVFAGSVRWCQKQLGLLAVSDDGNSCSRCCGVTAGPEHLWFECPEYDDVRSKHPDAVRVAGEVHSRPCHGRFVH